LAFAAAAFLRPATPPVLAMAATFNPTLIILPSLLNLFNFRSETIYTPFPEEGEGETYDKILCFAFSCSAG